MPTASKEAGIAALRSGDPQLALRHLAEALRQDRSDPEVYGYLGVTCGQLNLLDKAVGCLREGVRLAPQSPMLHYNLGLALEQTEQPREALRAFQHTLELEPDHDRARRGLQRVQRSLAAAAHPVWPLDGHEPVTIIEEALRREPSFLNVLPVLAPADRGRPPTALARWEGQAAPAAAAEAVHRLRLLIGAAAMLLIGALVGPQLGAIANTSASVLARREPTAAASAPAPAGHQRFAARTREFFREIDAYYRQTAAAIDRLDPRQPARTRRARAMVTAYVATVEARRGILEQMLEQEAHRADFPPVGRSLLRAVNAYEAAGRAWQSYLPERREFWRERARAERAAAQNELEAIAIVLRWQRARKVETISFQ